MLDSGAVQGESATADAAVLPRTAGEALRLHGGWLRAVATARLKSTQGADDVMQEVAAAALRNWPTLQAAQNAKPWLYRLTVRAALMHRRALGRARKRLHQAEQLQLARSSDGTSAQAGPLEALLAAERHARLRQAMTRLPPRDAELLMMKHVDDCSYKEIASRLNVTVAVVEMRLFRARQKLRVMLDRNACGTTAAKSRR